MCISASVTDLLRVGNLGGLLLLLLPLLLRRARRIFVRWGDPVERSH
jgi:hypothetical protein